MKTYIALFRGINVGGKNILPMKDLKKILEQEGCSNVKTFIQSGNVVFQIRLNDREKLAEDISGKILKKHGFEPKILLLDSVELRAAVENNPFDANEGKALHFYFLSSKPASPDLDQLTEAKSGSEDFKLHGNVFYLYAPDGIGRSKLAAKVEQCLGVPLTARNWNTISKLTGIVNEF
jgi:uncharacterized protein (DUF1697 family)